MMQYMTTTQCSEMKQYPIAIQCSEIMQFQCLGFPILTQDRCFTGLFKINYSITNIKEKDELLKRV
jgi:hypothetical protein